MYLFNNKFYFLRISCFILYFPLPSSFHNPLEYYNSVLDNNSTFLYYELIL